MEQKKKFRRYVWGLFREVNGKKNLGRLTIQDMSFKTRMRKFGAECGGCGLI